MAAPAPIPDFGIRWPEGTPLVQRHTFCAYHNRGKGSFYHRKQIIKALWPSHETHEWFDRRLESTCNYHWNTWIGPGGSGKTTEAAVIGLQRWLEAPDRTAVIVCSTSKDMLRKRIWGSIAQYHAMLPKGLGPVGKLIDTSCLIRWKDGDVKNGIFGMAVEEGPIDQVINNLIGIHTHRVFLILDEMQGVREAIMRATRNMAKNPHFDFLGIGNPESITDPLGRYSEPVNGWDSVERAVTPSWEIHSGPAKGEGRCNFFDGRKSPAVLDPEFARRNPWMINAEQIENDRKAARGNDNDPTLWSQSIGWWPPLGIDSTVLDSAIVIKFRCRERAVWTGDFFRWASLDPSFEGGDKRPLTIGRCGQVTDPGSDDDTPQPGHIAPKVRWQIDITEQIEVPVDASSTEPLHYQIARWVKEYLVPKGITPDHFALDSTGEGGGLKSIFDIEWGPVVGIEFGGAPSDNPVPGKPDKTAREEYDRRASELNFNVRDFALADGLRGLPILAETQFCARKTMLKNRKYAVEPKTTRAGGEKGYKQRMGHSPDHADSLAIGVALCIQLGASPGEGGESVAQSEQAWEAAGRSADGDFNESNYLESYDYA